MRRRWAGIEIGGVEEEEEWEEEEEECLFLIEREYELKKILYIVCD